MSEHVVAGDGRATVGGTEAYRRCDPRPPDADSYHVRSHRWRSAWSASTLTLVLDDGTIALGPALASHLFVAQL